MTYAVSKRGGRTAGIAARLLAVALALVAALHVYWALGGEWGLAAALGRDDVDSGPGLRVAAAVVAILLALAAASVLARVGTWKLPLPWRLLSVGAWLVVAALVLVAVANAMSTTSLERFGFAPLALALAALALIVARAERPS